MYPYRSGYVNYPYGGEVPRAANSPQLMHRLVVLEKQLAHLTKLIEENNKLLRSIEEQKNRVVTSGGGSVIVRM